MGKDASKNIRLGLFVLLGLSFLIAALYFIGSKQNIFGNTIRISAKFYDVGGLMKGHNVRYSGIDVGTVESVEFADDTSIVVVMVIDKESARFIKKNAIASIGTDGLMGNKLVNINSVAEVSSSINDGDELMSIRAVEMDEMVRTLAVTNENIKNITIDVKRITEKINNSKSLWGLLSDTTMSVNTTSILNNLATSSRNAAVFSNDMIRASGSLRQGEGLIGALLYDTAYKKNLSHTLENLGQAVDSVTLISGDVRNIARKIQNSDGVAAALLSDSTLLNDLEASMDNLKTGTAGFSENMEALKHNFFFRRYFRKLEKEKKKRK